MLLPGMLIERYGIKNTYLISISIVAIAFLLLIVTKNIVIHVILINLVLGLAVVIIYASLKAGLSESTTLENRSLGFSIYVSASNFSSIMLGLFYELVIYLNGLNMTSFRIIFLVFIGISLLELILIILFSKLEKPSSSFESQIRICEILNQKRFWKTLFVIILSAIPMGGIYFVGIILPIYMDREVGSIFGYGLFFAGFSLMLGVFSILFNFITNYLSIYNCIVLGGFITASGPLMFFIDSRYFGITAYVFITAIGGAIVEARIIDYNGFASVKG
jgi:MFS family permease